MRCIKPTKEQSEWREKLWKQYEENKEKAYIIGILEKVIMAHFTLEEVKRVVQFVEVILKEKDLKGDFDYLKNLKTEV